MIECLTKFKKQCVDPSDGPSFFFSFLSQTWESWQHLGEVEGRFSEGPVFGGAEHVWTWWLRRDLLWW